jgi:hypothetical protein
LDYPPEEVLNAILEVENKQGCIDYLTPAKGGYKNMPDKPTAKDNNDQLNNHRSHQRIALPAPEIKKNHVKQTVINHGTNAIHADR